MHKHAVLSALVNKPWALPSEVLKVTVIFSMRAGGLLNFRKVRSTNPSLSLREYDTGSNPTEITILLTSSVCVCVCVEEREREREE